jgi:hypothetical protein
MKSNFFLKILYLIAVLFFQSAYLTAQISPGELCKAHADLEGASNCTKCHEVGNKVTREKCLACHKEIKTNIDAGKGYHASSEVKGKNCASCHNDHHGRDFQIIKFNKKAFNHDKTGFSLKGVHAKQDCNACHNAQRIKDPELKKRTGTYLGLQQECLSCHTDFHQSKLSSKCTECHNFDSWKNAKRFDHSKTHFPLLGKHMTVGCIECHKTEMVNGKKVQRFKGLVFNNCTGCHQDVHKGKFGQNCKECHTEESFHFNKEMKAFNHDKTSFKLIGKHKQVDCKECHKGSLMTPLKHNNCFDCHKDYHKGEFNTKNSKPDCIECHTNDGFTPSTFTVEKHNKGKFKLEEAHLATSCNACHKKDGKNWTFRNIGSRCVDCHQNEHKGFIEDKFMSNEDCQACHTVKSWKVEKFDHDKTGYTLEGAHATTACSDCHYGKNENGVRTQQFKGLSKECSSCHKDSHVGQFAVNGKTDCTSCHGLDKWENSKFDHNTSRFKLDGAHATVKCEECHKQVVDEKGKYIAYKFADISCASCHKK